MITPHLTTFFFFSPLSSQAEQKIHRKDPSPSHTLVLKEREEYSDFNKTWVLLISFLTFKPKQQWNHLKIFSCHMVFQTVIFLLNLRILSLAFKNIFSRILQEVYVIIKSLPSRPLSTVIFAFKELYWTWPTITWNFPGFHKLPAQNPGWKHFCCTAR